MTYARVTVLQSLVCGKAVLLGWNLELLLDPFSQGYHLPGMGQVV